MSMSEQKLSLRRGLRRFKKVSFGYRRFEYSRRYGLGSNPVLILAGIILLIAYFLGKLFSPIVSLILVSVVLILYVALEILILSQADPKFTPRKQLRRKKGGKYPRSD